MSRSDLAEAALGSATRPSSHDAEGLELGSARDARGGEQGLSPDDRNMERNIALIRVAVVTVVAAVYLSSIGIQRQLGPLALSLLALAALYSLWNVVARPYASLPPGRFRAMALLVDAGLVTLWCTATGGPESEFWSLYLIVVISVAMRLGLLETIGSALALSLLYVMVMSAEGRIPVSSLLSRPALMVITGFAVGLLAHERRTNEQQRTALERIAEERARALAAEQAVVARLRQVDFARTEFVAVASHEFRTPLAAILGVVGTLRAHGDQLEPEIRTELLDGAAAQTERLARLVDDLLAISRVEDGGIVLSPQFVHPKRLVHEAVEASGTSESVSVKFGGVERVWCDPDRIVRVLTNLLDNAGKYSPASATIYVSISEDDRDVLFSVRDEGPGIPKEQRDAVFERFRRLIDASETPGSGLGLYIARCLVEAHGGEISVREASGGGAEFMFRLPKAGADGAFMEAEDPPSPVAVK